MPLLLVKALLIAAILEATVFNIPTFRLWFGNYGEMSFTAEECSQGKDVDYRADHNDIAVVGDRSTVFTFEGIDEEIADVYVDISFGDGTKAAEVSIDAMDDTRYKDYRQLIAENTLIKGKPHSHYTQLHLSGNVSKLKVAVTPLDSGIVYIKALPSTSRYP